VLARQFLQDSVASRSGWMEAVPMVAPPRY
jgi:hypothetical protein